MMLRKANLKDYQIYRQLYEDTEFRYQWLYYTPVIFTEGKKKESFSMDIAEVYQNYTIQKFEKDLKKFRIFMIEKDGKALGSIQIFFRGKGTYEIKEWGMFEDDISIKKEVIEDIKRKFPKLKKIQVCTINDRAKDFFISVGFTMVSKVFFELVV